MTSNGPLPALDLNDVQRRAHRIYTERVKAREEAEECGKAEAEAEFLYLKKRQIRLSYYRTKEDMGVTEAMAHAEADAAEHRRERDIQALLKKSAWAKVEELEGNRAMLNQMAKMSEGLT
jgi:hypothetical protein